MEIKWSFAKRLEDLDFANDIALLAQRQTDNVPVSKTKQMRMNSGSSEAIQLYGTAIEEVGKLFYIGSKMTSDASCDMEIKSRLAKPSKACDILKRVWRAG